MEILKFYNNFINTNKNYNFKGSNFLKSSNNLAPLTKDTANFTPQKDKDKLEQEICGNIRELEDDEFEILLEKLNPKIEEFNKNQDKAFFNKNKIDTSKINKNNIFFIDKILTHKELRTNDFAITAIEKITSQNLSLEQIKVLCGLSDKIISSNLKNNYNFMLSYSEIITNALTKESAQAKNILLDKILSEKHLLKCDDFLEEISTVLQNTNTTEEAQARCDLIDLFMGHKEFCAVHAKTLGRIMHHCKNKETAQCQYKVFDKLARSNQYIVNNLANIISSAEDSNKTKIILQITDKILNTETLTSNHGFMNEAVSIITKTNTKDLFEVRGCLIDYIENNKTLCENKDFIQKFAQMLKVIKTQEQAQNAIKFLNHFSKKDDFDICSITPQLIDFIDNNIDYSTIKKLGRIFGYKTVFDLCANDVQIASQFLDLRHKNSTNELSAFQKKDFLKRLIKSNTDLFDTSKTLQKEFPILPVNKEQYCSLLPVLVKSLGIETKILSQEEISKFNKSLNDFSSILENLSDEEFNQLEISQEYSKDEFIKDVILIVKDLSCDERQKIYDYFGFELEKNEKTKQSFSITGYPINLNNDEKLKQIKNPATIQTIEKLRPFVVKFSQNNKIISNNPEIEKTLNEIITYLPELRTQINKSQHKTHNFDLFKHSIKTMQKITQNPEFKKLNESDKKILLLTSLFHDSNKKENRIDSYHPQNGAFDAFYISKKFNLTQDEQIKLYSLIKSHEWLAYVNNSKITPEEKEKREKDVAFDMQYDNFFEMAQIFTNADLKAVKEDDEFYDKYKNILETESKIIKNYINILKTTRPLLPVTNFPKSERINEAIKFVNQDGSTNLKGIYKDKDGLIVIKFNEVENDTWEKIGFEKGSISKGIQTTTDNNTEINTGNIKFFVHGLDYENQLSKFNAFSMPDSDALLSVSYAECPERKFRFFRPQGVILDCDTKFIHGGGNSDSGSGYGKNIQQFKDDYIFEGKKIKERTYISNLIKETLNLNDEEYIEFIEQNQNKSFKEITPKESQEKLIQAFARINSNKRKGDREYNEMFISNPKPPMAVFAYEIDKEKQVGNPLEFLKNEEYNKFIQGNTKEKTGFLRKYALENNIPFVVFGD